MRKKNSKMATQREFDGEDLKEFSTSNRSLANANRNNYKIAGFFKQLIILTWKNLILSKRSIVGTIV